MGAERVEGNGTSGDDPRADQKGSFRGRTTWEWAELAGPWLVALTLALFGSAQFYAQYQAEQQRAQDEALGAYLDQMSELILEKDLLVPQGQLEARKLAQARTLTVLGNVGPIEKRSVLQFLYEAELIGGTSEAGEERRPSVLSMRGADMRDADLYSARQGSVNRSGMSLGGADLSGADLSGADLRDADLAGADLSDAILRGADLGDGEDVDNRAANLSGADLSGVDLSDVRGLTNEQIEEQGGSLKRTIMPDGQRFD